MSKMKNLNHEHELNVKYLQIELELIRELILLRNKFINSNQTDAKMLMDKFNDVYEKIKRNRLEYEQYKTSQDS